MELVYTEWRVRAELKERMEKSQNFYSPSVFILGSSNQNQMSDEWTSQTDPSEKNPKNKKPNKLKTNEREERRLKIILCAPTQKQLERRIQVNLHVVSTVRNFSNVRSALMPPLMQALCSGTSEHALVRGPANVDFVHTVAFRRSGWTFT
ncbi:uncharacterized protein LJ206_005306 isoform 1-T1 [Theristicus caerulescens]